METNPKHCHQDQEEDSKRYPLSSLVDYSAWGLGATREKQNGYKNEYQWNRVGHPHISS